MTDYNLWSRFMSGQIWSWFIIFIMIKICLVKHDFKFFFEQRENRNGVKGFKDLKEEKVFLGGF